MKIVACRLHLDLSVGTEDLFYLEENQVTVSPNPASEFVTMNLELKDVADQVRVDILNYNGQIVHSEVIENVQEGSFDYNVNSFPAGYYFMSVKTPEGYRSVPFTVAR